MAGQDDWKRWVVYQIYPRSFADSDGDGVGDLPGIIAHLDHLDRLGVDVLWLSPVYRSPMDDNGYDISDYQDVDPLFGTLADLDELIARPARARHPAGHGPRGQPHLRRAPVVRGVAATRPTRSATGTGGAPRGRATRPAPPAPSRPTGSRSSPGSAWECDEASGEYYLHLFSRKQPDLNWENPEVRAAVYAMMRWWVDRGVDGFRMDVINLISQGPGPARRRCLARARCTASGTRTSPCGPRLQEFLPR